MRAYDWFAVCLCYLGAFGLASRFVEQNIFELLVLTTLLFPATTSWLFFCLTQLTGNDSKITFKCLEIFKN